MLSVELGPPIRCGLVSLLTTCSELHTLWEEIVSAHNLVIAHDHRVIKFYGRISLSDFQTYISTALRATVVHPFRLVLQNFGRMSQLSDLQQQFVPNIASHNLASIIVAVDYLFEYEDIKSYLHDPYMGLPALHSTSHCIYATCNGIEFRAIDLCLTIVNADICEDDVHALYAEGPVAYVEEEYPTTHLAYARKIARISSILFGLPCVASNRRSSIAVEWSEEEWPPHVIDAMFCEDACIGAAIRKADQDGTDVVVSALAQVQLAMQDNDNGTGLPITSLRISHEPEPGFVLEVIGS